MAAHLSERKLLCIAGKHGATPAALADLLPGWDIHTAASLGEASRALRHGGQGVGLVLDLDEAAEHGALDELPHRGVFAQGQLIPRHTPHRGLAVEAVVRFGGGIDVDDAIVEIQDDETVAEAVKDLSDLPALAGDITIARVRNGAPPAARYSLELILSPATSPRQGRSRYVVTRAQGYALIATADGVAAGRS